MQAESHEDYDTAVTTCEDMGAYLFYAKNIVEFNSFISLNPEYTEWYGIKRESQYSSNWLNSEGGTSSYKNWKYGEPNNSGYNEGCAEIKMGTTARNMNDIPCDRSKPFTCFKTVAVGEEFSQGDETCTCTSDGVVCRPSYTCTYFEKQPERATIDDALEACEAQESELTSFKTRTEYNQFLSTRQGAQDVEWVGYERTMVHGWRPLGWTSADGHFSFYIKWQSGQPNIPAYDMRFLCAEIQYGEGVEPGMNDQRCKLPTMENGDPEKSFSCRKTLNAGESVVEADENKVCECTENGMQCQTLTECPEFIKMDGEKTYAEAKAECAEMNGFVAFFKDESEHAKYLREDVTRKEWMGLERTSSASYGWKSADGGSTFFTKWASGEPNGGWSEQCSEIYMGGSKNGQMNDVGCHHERFFSCRVSVMTRGTCS